MTQKKVLLVDDVELFVELEKTFFRREEVTLLVARNGRQAVETVQKELPDLVFMDLFMPEMDGDEACRVLKQDPNFNRLPIIMVTHGGREADLERCRAAGCDEVLLKPVNRQQFLDTARHYLGLVERGAPRVEARLSVHYGDELGTELTDFAINISTGGLFLETDQTLAVGSALKLQFPVPGRLSPIVCRARVAWVNLQENAAKSHLPAGMGIQFVDLPLEDLQVIRDFVKTSSRQSGV